MILQKLKVDAAAVNASQAATGDCASPCPSLRSIYSSGSSLGFFRYKKASYGCPLVVAVSGQRFLRHRPLEHNKNREILLIAQKLSVGMAWGH